MIDKVVQALTGKSIAQNIDSLKGIINSAFGSINKSIEGSVGFFNSLKKSGTALVLLGDQELTENILLDKIIKEIFLLDV